MEARFLATPMLPYQRYLSGAGRMKIRGGAVVPAKADRIFLIFCFFLIKQKENRDKLM
jgi:hypothetical protein